MNASTSTGDSYIIHFPAGDAGGACAYTGAGRYLVQIGGVLTFQILADCGKLKRSYSYMICMLGAMSRPAAPERFASRASINSSGRRAR
jgi:hypothetical protein